jgi:hypothetical protein
MNFITQVLEPNRLLLVWQGPEGPSCARHSVAELIRLGEGQVHFRYLADTADFHDARAEGFVNFPAFRKVDHPDYDLGVVDTFIRRLPPRTRGDYAKYLEQFRLRPETRISDFALLAYTGAKLPSDGFSIVNPLDDVAEPGEFLIEVAGFRYATRVALESLHPGDEVGFVPEPDNSFDSNALAVEVRGQKIGYVPKQQACAVSKLLKAGYFKAQIERINGSPERPLVFLFAEVLALANVQPTPVKVRQ